MTSQKVVSKGAPLFEPFFDQKMAKKGSKMTHFQGLEGPGQVWASPDQGWPRIVRFSRCFLSGSGALLASRGSGGPFGQYGSVLARPSQYWPDLILLRRGSGPVLASTGQ